MVRKLILCLMGGVVLLIEYLVIFLLFFDIPVYADSFYPGGEINQCEFVPAVGVTLDSVPMQTQSGITYDSKQVQGLQSSWINTHTIHDVANVFAGQVKRYPNVAGNVAGPPGTKVGVGFWWLNFSGHTINVIDASLFLSQNRNPVGYDLSRVIEESLTQSSESYWHNKVVQTRTGKVLTTGNLGSFSNTSINSPEGGRKIATLTIAQPLEITKGGVECRIQDNGDIVMQKRVVIRNKALYSIDNVTVSSDSNFFNFQPAEEKQILFEENLGKQFQSSVVGSSVPIKNPNFHTECAVSGSTRGDVMDPATRIMLLKRDDQNHSDWWAIQPDFAAVPQNNYFCMTQIPYTVTLKDFACNIEQKLVPKLTFNHESIHPGDTQNFVIEIVNNGIGVQEPHIIVKFPVNNSDLFSGFQGATSIRTDNHFVYVEYTLPPLPSKGIATIKDFFTLNSPITPSDRKTETFIVNTATDETQASFIIQEEILKSAAVVISSQTANEINGELVLELTDRVSQFTVSISNMITGQITAVCGGVINFEDIEVTISVPSNGTLTLERNGVLNQITGAVKLSLSDFLSSNLLLSGTNTTMVEIPIKVTFAETENISISLSFLSCITGTNECKSSVITANQLYEHQCGPNLSSILLSKLSEFAILPILLSTDTKVSELSPLPVLEKINSFIWTGPVAATLGSVSTLSGNLASTGVNLLEILGYFTLFGLSSSFVLFLIFKSVSISNERSLPKNWEESKS